MGLFSKKNKQIEIFAPVDGKIIGLDKIEDEVFKEKMMGDGFAFDPANGEFVSPIDGELVSVFPTKHAYGIKHKSDVELLIHIGLDTVTLEGEGFNCVVSQGQKVKVGDKLVDVDLKLIAKKVPSIKTPLVFTNTAGKTIEIVKKGAVKKGDLVAILK
ncbi:PTS system, glucose-specific IIA component [Williamsoniiplasma somnilux]|uniref:PTS system, glucose-specific IIA component n=1 Tax=Williamsoniiplasma somnilux TaxID=215578 RepID=A0A2K8NYL1_9MOLU|nr:PTS glucose transporter subunit IIA [Williamsoniiplasma somnilux]ATZ18909.1 PTS system, glucose-specific IIA component [Williamsoniiplasma somnilux]